MTVSDLPTVNASLNALSTVFIVSGLVSIHREQKRAHTVCMVAALVTSTLFLASYLYYHYHHPTTRFAHGGWLKAIYYVILFTHIPLAVATVPLVFLSVKSAIQARWERHRYWSKWTVPVWLYVSVTGVLVYLMLYVWFPGPRPS